MTEHNLDRRSKGHAVIFLVAGLLVILIAVAVAWNFYSIRTPIRWFLWSDTYKSEVMGAKGELKHSEWDGWGFAGVDTNVYLVFDPADSLAAAAEKNNPGKLQGLPCEVCLVKRLESHWYTVQFYTGEFWGQRNALNCKGSQTSGAVVTPARHLQ